MSIFINKVILPILFKHIAFVAFDNGFYAFKVLKGKMKRQSLSPALP